MQFRYGKYLHKPYEVGLIAEVAGLRSSQDTEYGLEYTWNLDGKILWTDYNSDAGFQAAILALTEAYQQDDQDCGLYFIDGTPSIYTIALADVIGSIHVAKKPTATSYNGGVYRNFYPYSIQIKFRTDTNNPWGEIKEWVEELEFEGTGGPRWIMKTSLTGEPQQQILNLFTPIRVVQQGYAVGWTSYPDPPEPLFEDNEHEEMRRLHKAAPTTLGNAFGKGAALRDFKTTWSYAFEGNSSDFDPTTNPNTRPE